MFRIGQGFDVHQLVENRPLIIGGITIPYEKGLLGHSDADVLLHTVADACLGAIGEGDIIAQKPKMAPYIGEMKQNIASLLETEQERINIKASTTEKLGFPGRGEGITAQAVVLLQKI